MQTGAHRANVLGFRKINCCREVLIPKFFCIRFSLRSAVNGAMAQNKDPQPKGQMAKLGNNSRSPDGDRCVYPFLVNYCIKNTGRLSPLSMHNQHGTGSAGSLSDFLPLSTLKLISIDVV
ncbi:hypothetical protein HOLleu_43383 [Holothuria leucospilota]|uniref:Uncharacterized protein n=1 Tax=Holothuria leucospilota TaxID=206669 RepID=A0A9Q1B9R3_HOLLE|nr:hypothetical protein HOLleu_43383 [Holothuria leucospilota]